MAKDDHQDFRAFTIRYDGIANRITTHIALTEAYDPADPPDPPIPRHKITALWDTGASRSVIKPATVDALGLTSVGTQMTAHAGGQEETDSYVVNFFLPNMVAVIGVQVTECKNIVGDFGAIIGMDIIGTSDLAITNADGRTCMSFRIPSIETIDYAIEANRIRYAGVKPNAPCPCGKTDDKGKPIKFKFCHRKDRK